MAAILCGEENVKEIPAKAIWHNAAVVAGEGVHGLRGTIMGDFISPEAMKYVVVIGDDTDQHVYDEKIVGWNSFEQAGNPAERIEINLVKGVHPELFLRFFAEICGKKYVLLSHRGGAGYQCYHLAPVPDNLLKLPALMEFGGACSAYEGAYRQHFGGRNGVLMGP